MVAKAESIGIEISDEEKFYLFSSNPQGVEIMEKITQNLINAYGGLERFKLFIAEYGEYAKANYLTNDQILALDGDTRK